MKRICGRLAASQIAAASLASFVVAREPALPRKGEATLRFIITAQTSADKQDADAEEAFSEDLLRACMRFNEDMHKAGVLVASEGLNPAAKGARIAVSMGRRYAVDGPFAESMELVG